METATAINLKNKAARTPDPDHAFMFDIAGPINSHLSLFLRGHTFNFLLTKAEVSSD